MATLRAAIDARGATRGAAEFDRAAGKMKRSAGTATKSIDAGFSMVMRRIAIFGGAGGAVYTLKKFIDSASDAQETTNKFNVVFRDNAKEAAAWSEQFGDSVGRATQDVQKWMAGLQDLFVPLGFARKEAMGLSMDLTKLAVDVASFNDQADADVIRDFTSALVGNHEVVRKFGIIISETSLAQEALNQNLGKAYKDLTDLEKVQLRYSLIQKGTTDAQGDAVRSMDDYANQVKRLGANWTETKTVIGEQVIPALSELLKSINAFAEGGNLKALMHENIAVLYEFGDVCTNVDELFKSFGMKKWSKTYAELAAEQRLLASQARRGFSNDVLMGQLPAESNEAALNRRLQEVYAGPAEITGPTNVSDKEREAAEKAAADLAEARVRFTARMYEDMGRFDEGYYQSQVALLDQQKAEYGQYVDDKVLLDEWYFDRLDKLSQESHQKEMNSMDEYMDDLENRLGDMPKKWADTAASIEGSMANAFDSMIAGGASFEDAMTGFARDIGRAFSRMAAQMAAEAVMYGALSGGKAIFGIPSAMGNVFDRGRLVPMANGAVLDRPTYFPMADGKTGLAGEAGLEGVLPLRRGPGGRLGVETSGGQPVINNEIKVKMVVVSNQREATIEALKTDDGEKAIIRTLYRNGFAR